MDQNRPIPATWAPRHELQRAAVKECVLEAAAAVIGGEAEKRDDMVARGGEGGKGELVLQLALTLQRLGVHKLDGNKLAGARELAALDGTAASLAELVGRGKVFSGVAELGVGEVGGGGLGELGGGGAVAGEAEAEEDEERGDEEGSGSGSDGDDEGGEPVGW